MSNWWRVAVGGLKEAAETPWRRSYFTIQAIPREITGNRVASRERAQGRIPTVVSSRNYVLTDPSDSSSVVGRNSESGKRILTTERKQIKTILKSLELPFFYSTIFPLQIRAGSGSSTLLESGKVLPVKIDRDKETGEILNLEFVWAEDGKELKVNVPIVFTGEGASPGLLKGGKLKKLRSHLSYLCPAELIPPKVAVDVSNLDIGDRVLPQDIEVNSSLKLVCTSKRPVCKIVATDVEPLQSST